MKLWWAVALFKIGSALIIFGARVRGDTPKHLRYLRWEARVELAELKKCWRRGGQS